MPRCVEQQRYFRQGKLQQKNSVNSDGTGSAQLRHSEFESMPMVPSHFSTNWGHSVMGNFVRRNP